MSMRQVGGWFALYVGGALGLGLLVLALLIAAWESQTAPAHIKVAAPALSQIPPFVEGGFIKVPVDIERTRECLAQSTFSLVRQHAYPQPLGEREDKVQLALYNNPISGVGDYHGLLWFPRPELPEGVWEVTIQVGRDCGNWLIRPGTSQSDPISLGKLRLSP